MGSSKLDISNREDIESLVDSFYKKVIQDDTIGYFFNEVTPIDWDIHMPIMYDFWETTIFHKALYKGNPISKHIVLHNKSPMNKSHFDRWVSLFHSTIDHQFEGPNAALAKQRASSIAMVIQVKIAQLNG